MSDLKCPAEITRGINEVFRNINKPVNVVKLQCPNCHEKQMTYKRGYQGKEFRPQWIRRLLCSCGLSIHFINTDYRKTKSLLFPERKECEWVEQSIGGYITECNYPASMAEYHTNKYCPHCGGLIMGGE